MSVLSPQTHIGPQYGPMKEASLPWSELPSRKGQSNDCHQYTAAAGKPTPVALLAQRKTQSKNVSDFLELMGPVAPCDPWKSCVPMVFSRHSGCWLLTTKSHSTWGLASSVSEPCRELVGSVCPPFPSLALESRSSLCRHTLPAWYPAG